MALWRKYLVNNEFKNEIVIYKSEEGQIEIDVKMQDETIWLTQDAIVKLFDSSKANISEHISHIYEEKELYEDSTVRKFRTVRKEGKRNVSRNLEYYNLDLILSVGYRVKSKVATKFRQWATGVLRNHIIKQQTIKDTKEVEKNLKTIQNAITICARAINNQAETLNDAKHIINTLDKFTQGLDLLDNFDHKTLDTKGNTQKEAVKIPEDEFLKVVDKMKSEFASDVFANPKDGSFASSVNQIYQTFDGAELYPTLEEKAAMLLYLITKNHSFSDGNKRIAASCFLYFMDKNGILYDDGTPIIDNATLFALTVLIAESNPAEMETMKNVVVSVLNGGDNANRIN